MFDRRDSESVHRIVLVDGDVLADDKLFVAEAEPDFVVLFSPDVIVKRPVAVGLPDQMTDVLVIGTEADNTTLVPVIPPKSRIDPAIVIQRGDEDVAIAPVSSRMRRFTRKLQANSKETARERICSPVRMDRIVFHKPHYSPSSAVQVDRRRRFERDDGSFNREPGKPDLGRRISDLQQLMLNGYRPRSSVKIQIKHLREIP